MLIANLLFSFDEYLSSSFISIVSTELPKGKVSNEQMSQFARGVLPDF